MKHPAQGHWSNPLLGLKSSELVFCQELWLNSSVIWRNTGSLAQKQEPAPEERISKRRAFIKLIQANVLHSCCSICWRTLIVWSDGSFKLSKGLTAFELLLLCAWVLGKQFWRFLLNNQNFSQILIDFSLIMMFLWHNAVFACIDIHPSNANHENWDSPTGLSILGAQRDSITTKK